MSYQCQVQERSVQPTLVFRARVAVQDLPQTLGQAYGAIAQYLGELGEQPAGPPFTAYHNMDMTALDVEIGFPVASRQEGSGDVEPGKIPGGRAAVGMHTGPYDTIRETYDALSAFMETKGLEMDAFCYEFYLNDPRETPPEELKMEIYFPIRE